MNPDDTPEGRDLIVAQMTVAGRSVAHIASELSISPSTIHRSRAANREWIDARRTERAEEVAATLLAAVDGALTRLVSLLQSPNDGVALGAAKFVLDSASKWHQEIEVERRLSALEERHRRGEIW